MLKDFKKCWKILEMLVHIDRAIRDQSMIWKILDEASAESNIDKILNEASAEFNISKMTWHTKFERSTNNIVRGFSRVQYCWYDFQAECGVLFWPYNAMMEYCTVNMDFIVSLRNTRISPHLPHAIIFKLHLDLKSPHQFVLKYFSRIRYCGTRRFDNF